MICSPLRGKAHVRGRKMFLRSLKIHSLARWKNHLFASRVNGEDKSPTQKGENVDLTARNLGGECELSVSLSLSLSSLEPLSVPLDEDEEYYSRQIGYPPPSMSACVESYSLPFPRTRGSQTMPCTSLFRTILSSTSKTLPRLPPKTPRVRGSFII